MASRPGGFFAKMAEPLKESRSRSSREGDECMAGDFFFLVSVRSQSTAFLQSAGKVIIKHIQASIWIDINI
jgi:hypothetical protein